MSIDERRFCEHGILMLCGWQGERAGDERDRWRLTLSEMVYWDRSKILLVLFDLLRSFECLGSIILTSGVRCTA
jgi:hypothetical protein